MARIASQALAGYYPLQEKYASWIGTALADAHLSKSVPRWANSETAGMPVYAVNFLDPCCGDGEALVRIAAPVLAVAPHRVRLYGFELERERYLAAREKFAKAVNPKGAAKAGVSVVTHGDATTMHTNKGSVSVLYLNPPYDTDPYYGRLEARFMRKTFTALGGNSVLVAVIPASSLSVCAPIVASHFKNFHIVRLPSPDYEVFKQVVIFATEHKYYQTASDAEVQAFLKLCEAPEDLPELTEQPSSTLMRLLERAGSTDEQVFRATLLGIDHEDVIRSYKPFWRSAGKVVGKSPLAPPPPLQITSRVYPSAMPPKAAHLAAAIATGVLDGVRVDPDDILSDLPPLIIKGRLELDWVTIRSETKDVAVKGSQHKEKSEVLTQIEKPSLRVTFLNVNTGDIGSFKTTSEITENLTDLSEATIGDLFKNYGQSLQQIVEKSCPPLHDPRKPEQEIPLAKVALDPFDAQRHAAMACVKLLGGYGASKTKQRGKSAMLLGEVGVGKTLVSLTVLKTMGSNSPLVLCPPHLVAEWEDQVRRVLPEYRPIVLNSIDDVVAVSKEPKFDHAGRPNRRVLILSREKAKLGYPHVGVGSPPTSDKYSPLVACPECGGIVEGTAETNADKRARCNHIIGYETNIAAMRPVLDWLIRYAYMLPPTILPITRVPFRRLLTNRDRNREKIDAEFIDELKRRFPNPAAYAEELKNALEGVNAVRGVKINVEDVNASIIRAIHEFTTLTWPRNNDKSYSASHETFKQICASVAALSVSSERKSLITILDLCVTAYRQMLEEFSAAKVVPFGPVRCNAPLFAASPQPRRFSLAKFITRKYKDIYDFYIFDEAQDGNSVESAQSIAANRLAKSGVPGLRLTGSMMNGYAHSMFSNFWHVSPRLRDEYDYEELRRFSDDFGFKKRKVVLSASGKVEHGKASDRKPTNKPDGFGPGVAPTFLVHYLLERSVLLHKEDLKLGLPPMVEMQHKIEVGGGGSTAGGELRARYELVADTLIERIKADRFTPKAGKLFGAVAELPSYLDLASADTGNRDGGVYAVEYPPDGNDDDDEEGSRVIAVNPIYTAADAKVAGIAGLKNGANFRQGSLEYAPLLGISPKEQWVLDTIKAELAEGRRSMVLVRHVPLIRRLEALCKNAGIKAVSLLASAVPTGKRKDWINNAVVGVKADVLICNPMTVQTGLNNLVYFSTQIWVENPACNPIVYRQAIGRCDRIGKTLPTRVHFPVYDVAAPTVAYKLLRDKVQVSMAADGLDPATSIDQLGDDDSVLDTLSMSVGQAIYQRMTGSAS